MSGREISKNIVKIDIRILALLITVVFFSIVILFLSVNISSNKYEQEDETAMKMTGIYYGDGATAECKPGYLCRSGYSSEQYVELRDDRTCNTNINFIGWTGACEWGDNTDARTLEEFPFCLVFSGTLRNNSTTDDLSRKNSVCFRYENDRLIIFQAYLKKEP